MNSYIFNSVSYHLAEDVYKYEPESFVGCSKNTRQMIIKRQIPEQHHLFAAFIKSKSIWEIKDKKYNLAKPFISAEWCQCNLFALKKEKTEEDLKIEASKAPDILILEEEEKFKNVDGDVLEIEVRGEKNVDKIYFLAKDVEVKFNLNSIRGTIQNRTSQGRDITWKESIHFVRFRITKGDRMTNAPELFLTFSGLMKLLYISHSKNAEHFQSWANRILFTHKLGTREEKRALASSLLGVDARAVKEVFRADSKSLPCIYLFSLNEVKYLRKSMEIPLDIPDDSIVFKYGFTKDLERRTSEHVRTLGNIDGCDLKLKTYAYIDPQFLAKAETTLKDYVNIIQHEYSYKSNNEVVIIPRESLALIQDQFEMISRAYLGHLTEIVSKLKEAESAVREVKLQAELDRTKEKLNEATLQLRIQALEYEILALKNNV